MINRVVSKDKAKITAESAAKNKEDEVIMDDHTQAILDRASHLPMKVIRTDQDIMEFFED